MTRRAGKTTAQEEAAIRRLEAHHLVQHLATVETGVKLAEEDPAKAAEGLEDDALANATALVQDLKARLTLVERDLATALGKRLGKTTGELADGRQFKLERSSDRKEWDHEDWKRDARRAIVTTSLKESMGYSDAAPLDTALVGIIRADGEVIDTNVAALLFDVVAKAQEVHGSTSPRTTQLRALGLYASDYCTSTPGGWRFTAIKPTTKEDTTNA